MQNKFLLFVAFCLLPSIGAFALGLLVATSPLGGGIISVAPTEMTLTDSQLYLMTEILQDRVPQYDTSKYDTVKVTEDYIKMQTYVKDDITGALQFCLVHRGDPQCDLYKRIQANLNATKL